MIEQIQVQTPSARGAATLYKIKARNLKTKTRSKIVRGTDALNDRASSAGRSSICIAMRTRSLHGFAIFNQFSFR